MVPGILTTEANGENEEDGFETAKYPEQGSRNLKH